MNTKLFCIAWLCSICLFIYCNNNKKLLDAKREKSGGAATIFNTSANAFGLQVSGLNTLQQDSFSVGNAFFRTNWVAAPASAKARDGLGPLFNAVSCGSCHFKDGRAKPTNADGSINAGLLFRFNLLATGAKPKGDLVYGTQLQTHAILKHIGEGQAEITYTTINGTYADGKIYSLHQPNYSFNKLAYGTPKTKQFSPRIAQQLIGLGLLETIDDKTILNLADEKDNDNNGISGKPNFVWNESEKRIQLGRFGWKANQPNIKQQTAAAFSGDIGITSSIFTNNKPIEISDNNLNQVVFYIKTLAVPARRNMDDEHVQMGEKLFYSIGCVGCHTPKLQTGKSPITALHNQTIYPFTDMLLHDMGKGLADNCNDFYASGKEWRTPPLWGIGLIKTVNSHTNFLHDGRARNIEEAILWHDGEAAQSNRQFKELSLSQRKAVIVFIESL